jgi:hypothetical protein
MYRPSTKCSVQDGIGNLLNQCSTEKICMDICPVKKIRSCEGQQLNSDFIHWLQRARIYLASSVSPMKINVALEVM